LFIASHLPTATGDYMSTSMDVILESDQLGLFQCVPIAITDDGVTEPCERLFGTLSTGISRVKLGNNTSIIINDDDRKWCL